MFLKDFSTSHRTPQAGTFVQHFWLTRKAKPQCKSLNTLHALMKVQTFHVSPYFVAIFSIDSRNSHTANSHAANVLPPFWMVHANTRPHCRTLDTIWWLFKHVMDSHNKIVYCNLQFVHSICFNLCCNLPKAILQRASIHARWDDQVTQTWFFKLANMSTHPCFSWGPAGFSLPSQSRGCFELKACRDDTWKVQLDRQPKCLAGVRWIHTTWIHTTWIHTTWIHTTFWVWGGSISI